MSNQTMVVDGVTVPMSSAEITQFLADQAAAARVVISPQAALDQALAGTPAAVVDLITVLIAKGVITAADLQPATQATITTATTAMLAIAAPTPAQ